MASGPSQETDRADGVSLTNVQIKTLAQLAVRHPHSVTIRNEGMPWLSVQLRNAQGDVVERFHMPYDGELVPLSEGERPPRHLVEW
jgi:hypothetical protein